jgi:pilus assembly protein Flp/PilA
MSKFVAFLNDESGASAAEYVLILAIIGSAIVAAMTAFGQSIATALGNAGTALTQDVTFTPAAS